jgi:hypothetical protein
VYYVYQRQTRDLTGRSHHIYLSKPTSDLGGKMIPKTGSAAPFSRADERAVIANSRPENRIREATTITPACLQIESAKAMPTIVRTDGSAQWGRCIVAYYVSM